MQESIERYLSPLGLARQEDKPDSKLVLFCKTGKNMVQILFLRLMMEALMVSINQMIVYFICLNHPHWFAWLWKKI